MFFEYVCPHQGLALWAYRPPGSLWAGFSVLPSGPRWPLGASGTIGAVLSSDALRSLGASGTIGTHRPFASENEEHEQNGSVSQHRGGLRLSGAQMSDRLSAEGPNLTQKARRRPRSPGRNGPPLPPDLPRFRVADTPSAPEIALLRDSEGLTGAYPYGRLASAGGCPLAHSSLRSSLYGWLTASPEASRSLSRPMGAYSSPARLRIVGDGGEIVASRGSHAVPGPECKAHQVDAAWLWRWRRLSRLPWPWRGELDRLPALHGV